MNMFRQENKFQTLLQKLLKSDIHNLKPSEYYVFWDLIQDSSENIVLFISELIHSIMHIEHAKKSAYSSDLPSLIATLSCLTQFKKIFSDKLRFSMLLELESQWSSQMKIEDNNLNVNNSPYTRDTVSGIFNLFLEADEVTRIKTILNQIFLLPAHIKKVLNPKSNSVDDELMLDEKLNIENEKQLSTFFKLLTSYYSHMELYQKQYKSDSQLYYGVLENENYESLETGEISFSYEFLYFFLNENKCTLKSSIPDYILNIIVENLKVIPYVVYKFRKQAEQSLISLLHFIKQIFTFFPLNPTHDLREHDIFGTIINEIENYKRWPFPIGFMATELVAMLFNESKALGNAFRYKLREEIPQLDVLDSENNNSEEKFIKNVYCIYDENENSMIGGIMSQNSEKFDEKYSNSLNLDAHMLRILLIAHIIYLNNKCINKELLIHLCGLSKRDAFSIYCRALNVLEKCEELDLLGDIKLVLEKALPDIEKEIFSMRSENSDVSFKLQKLLFEDYLNCVPIYPESFFIRLDDREKFGNNEGTPPNKRSEEEKKIKGNFTLKIKEILEGIKQINLPLHQETLKILIIGGDSKVQTIIQEMGVLFNLNYQLFTNIDIELYVVPIKKNTLASYLASKDLWYQRFVYLPFKEDFFVPKLDTNIDILSNVKGAGVLTDKNIFPCFIKEKIIQSYLREATRCLSLKIYEIHIYKFDIRQQKSDEILYFGLYVELGDSVEFEKLKQTKKTSYQTINEFKENEGKCKNLDLEITMTIVDMTGFVKNKETTIGSFQSIKINNIYKVGFEGTSPFPNSEWLEVCMVDAESGRNRDNSLKAKNLFKKHTREQMQNAFKALSCSTTIHSISIHDTTNNGFDILVDGKIVEGVKKLSINPLMSTEKKDFGLNLPIMTFLPLNL